MKNDYITPRHVKIDRGGPQGQGKVNLMWFRRVYIYEELRKTLISRKQCKSKRWEKERLKKRATTRNMVEIDISHYLVHR